MNFNFQIIKNKKIFFFISAAIIVLGAALFIFRGFNMGVDFTGGTTLQFNMGRTLSTGDLDEIHKTVADAVGIDIPNPPQKIRMSAGSDGIEIKAPSLTSEQRSDAKFAVIEKYDLSEELQEDIMIDSVDPTVGKDMRNTAILATSVAIVLMLVYITFRFEFFSGLSTVICLMHDVLITLIFYSLLQIPMNMTLIAVILTIIGYSINTSIIFFDRVRENMKLDRKISLSENANKSINQTFMRSINTTITTLFTIGMIYILGVKSIQDFALPIIIGIAAGFYSSFVLAGNLWTTFRKDTKAAAK